jgi:hypothetical protein
MWGGGYGASCLNEWLFAPAWPLPVLQFTQTKRPATSTLIERRDADPGICIVISHVGIDAIQSFAFDRHVFAFIAQTKRHLTLAWARVHPCGPVPLPAHRPHLLPCGLYTLTQSVCEAMEIPFNERGVSVTRNALSAAGQVFPLREIRAVRVVTIQKNKAVPFGISGVGLVGAIVGGVLGSGAGFVCGVMLIVVGYLAWTTQDITHRLMIESGDSEREALSSLELAFVERVEQAVRAAQSPAPVAQD